MEKPREGSLGRNEMESNSVQGKRAQAMLIGHGKLSSWSGKVSWITPIRRWGTAMNEEF